MRLAGVTMTLHQISWVRIYLSTDLLQIRVTVFCNQHEWSRNLAEGQQRQHIGMAEIFQQLHLRLKIVNVPLRGLLAVVEDLHSRRTMLYRRAIDEGAILLLHTNCWSGNCMIHEEDGSELPFPETLT